jgi:2-polyprenyl-3-methyl-5-hydroxy-6-metoxy-1,4-benzoquinol methylase
MNRPDPLSDAKVIDSWRTNATPWSDAVRSQQIESRRLVTDRAAIEAVESVRPGTVLDLGCGEGWLARALAERGMRVTGVDAVPALIEVAAKAGGGDFRVASYEDITAGALRERFDAVVANFSLIGGPAVDALIEYVPNLLNPGGYLVIQTLHPVTACGDLPYEDGWRAGSWAGFSANFTDPAPWYFRTLESWERLIARAGLRQTERREPLNPNTGRPASVLLIARVAG